MSQKIDTCIFAKLVAIFQSKGWSLITDDFVENRFNAFCDMLSRLDEKQQELILELTQNFLWLGIQKYTSELKSVFSKVEKANKREIIDSPKYHIVPLLKPEDFKKNKSSLYLSYHIKSYTKYFESFFHRKSIIVHDNYDYILSNKEKTNEIIFLVDDFIGSGETAEGAIKYLLNNDVEKDRLVILALVAQSEGFEKIQSLNIDIYASQIRKKGITGYYTPEDAKKMLDTMDTIERFIKVKPKFKYGYSASEALVSMSRTPNNTFPIYWYESKKIPNVPFPR